MSIVNSQTRLRPTSKPGRQKVLWILFAALGVGLLLWIAPEALLSRIHGFDRAILLAIQNLGDPADPSAPPILVRVARDITSLGSTTVMTLVTLSVVGFLVLTNRFRTGVLVLASIAGGAVLSKMLKLAFDRPRPDVMPHAEQVYNASFPSGHALMAAITYLTLGALLAGAQTEPRLKKYLLLWSACLTLLVGTSRVVLGVHWPTDVVGGWCVGSLWAFLCWSIGERIDASRSIVTRRV